MARLVSLVISVGGKGGKTTAGLVAPRRFAHGQSGCGLSQRWGLISLLKAYGSSARDCDDRKLRSIVCPCPDCKPILTPVFTTMDSILRGSLPPSK